ncbi:MAG: hypothetical protein SPI14_05060 [Arcanobacterium sp.]|nr:hypothetical protein [Arcanobacterium sp.]
MQAEKRTIDKLTTVVYSLGGGSLLVAASLHLFIEYTAHQKSGFPFFIGALELVFLVLGIVTIAASLPLVAYRFFNKTRRAQLIASFVLAGEILIALSYVIGMSSADGVPSLSSALASTPLTLIISAVAVAAWWCAFVLGFTARGEKHDSLID